MDISDLSQTSYGFPLMIPTNKTWEVLGKLCIVENFNRYIDSTKEYTKYIYKYL